MDKLSYKSLLIIVTVLLIGIVFLLRIQKKGTTVLAEWWNDSWNYRQTINITSHTSTESNVYVIATVNIGTTTKSQPDNGDFRFTDQFGNLLSYYISANTGTTAPTFHIQIPSFPAGAQTFYAYYGNATADNGFSPNDFSTQATSYTVGSYGTEEIGGGPIAWWKFNEAIGTSVLDSSPNHYNGSFGAGTSAPTWQSGDQCHNQSCLNFDGINDKITIGSTISSIKTVSMWFKSSNAVAPIVDFDNGTHYISGSGGTISATGFTSPTIYINGKQTTSYNDNEWTHVLVTTNTSFNGSAIALGKVASSFLNGQIDNLKIFNYVESASQIKTDFNDQGGIQIGGHQNNLNNGLVYYYKFDENYGTTTKDSTSNISATLATGNSSPTWTTNGKINNALSFSGNDYLSVGSTSSIYSVSLWYNSSNTAPSFFDFNSSVNVGASSSVFYGTGISTPTFYVDGIASTNIGATNTWHHFVMVTASPINANSLKIGKSGTKYHTGTIDEVKFYNYSLLANEVVTDLNNNSSLSINSTNQTIGSTTTSLEYCIPGDTSPCTPPTARWKFDENIGSTALDSSGNNYNGSLTSGTLRYVPGKIGGSFLTTNSDGNLDMVLVGDIAALDFTNSQSFTISSWVKHIAKENSNYFIYYKGGQTSSNTGYNFGINSSTKYECNYTDGNASGMDTVASTTTADSDWHFISCVMDRTGTTTGTVGFHIFVDGKLESSDTSLTEGSSVNSSDIQIGETDSAYEMAVGIDDLRVYSYARTSAQIAYDFNQGSPTAWWKLDECQGSTVYSSASVGNTGTITIGVGGSQTSLGTCSIGATTAWSQGSVGKYNSSLNFDGTDDRLNIYSVGLTNVFNPLQGSASLWLKMTPTAWADTSATRAALWIAADTSNYIRIIKTTTANELIVNYVAGSTAKGLTFQTADNSNWMHIVLTWDKPNDRVKVYVNGKLSNTSTSLGTWAGAIASTRANIGARLSDGTDPFKGLIDDVRLYNYPLTDVQVKQIMNNGNFTLK